MGLNRKIYERFLMQNSERRSGIAATRRMRHNLRMAEKMVLLLGDIAHEGVTSALQTSGVAYKWKFLNSSVENWKSIIRILQKNDVKMVLGKLTGGIYAQLADPDYKDVSSQLLKEIATRPHRLFAYEDLLGNKESSEVDENGDERFWRPTVKVMKTVNGLFKLNGIDVLPYRKRAEVTVSAQSFVKETDEGLLFRLYVPSGRLWANQMGQLLSLFKDYLTKVAGFNVRLDQQSTSKGVIYAFHGADLGSDENDHKKLSKHFEDFTKLTDLCATDPSAFKVFPLARPARTLRKSAPSADKVSAADIHFCILHSYFFIQTIHFDQGFSSRARTAAAYWAASASVRVSARCATVTRSRPWNW
jgi:hypothetical protein